MFRATTKHSEGRTVPTRRSARRARAVAAVVVAGASMTACSVTQTAQVLDKPEAQVTLEDRVTLWNLANPSGGGFPSDAWFFALGRCEQPGGGHAGVAWDTHGPTYEGGLGFWYGTWDQYAPQVLPSPPANGGDAPWWDQVRVARHLFSLYGPSPWGCAPIAGPAY